MNKPSPSSSSLKLKDLTLSSGLEFTKGVVEVLNERQWLRNMGITTAVTTAGYFCIRFAGPLFYDLPLMQFINDSLPVVQFERLADSFAIIVGGIGVTITMLIKWFQDLELWWTVNRVSSKLNG